ncbi:hypothetical protein CBM2633_U10096 [Cupriavidus taiwanensis]|nr:hypothetical protein CBM2633_U10096 [Cupriavidus taiwanensis]
MATRAVIRPFGKPGSSSAEHSSLPISFVIPKDGIGVVECH